MTGLVVAPGIVVPAGELGFAFVRASGPGGQKVNKVSTAVELRFDLAASPSLPPDMKARAARMAGRRLGGDGVIRLVAERFRTQAANRRDAVERLQALLAAAAERPRARRATRPGAGARARRLEAKARRGAVKAGRGPVTGD